MRKITAILLAAAVFISVSACGKKQEPAGVDKEKVNAILDETDIEIDDELLTADEKELMESLLEFTTFAVHTIYDYPEGMDPTKNYESIKNISNPATLEYNALIIAGYSSSYKEMKVVSANFYDIDIYEDPDMKDLLGITGEIEVTMDGKSEKTQITVVLNFSDPEKITLEHILS